MSDDKSKAALLEEPSTLSSLPSDVSDAAKPEEDNNSVVDCFVITNKKKLQLTTTRFTSGGATGADFMWAKAVLRNKSPIDIMTFPSHSRTVPQGANVIELSEAQLKEANARLTKSARALKRALPKPGYVEKLLQRNWFIVKDAEAVFAIGKVLSKSVGTGLGIDGGTAWGCQMYFDRCLEEGTEPLLWLFDLKEKQWLKCTIEGKWQVCKEQPSPVGFSNLALVGSRDLGAIGEAAINKIKFI